MAEAKGSKVAPGRYLEERTLLPFVEGNTCDCKSRICFTLSSIPQTSGEGLEAPS